MPTTPYDKTTLPAEVAAGDISSWPTSDIETHFNKLLRGVKELWACLNGADAGNDANGVALEDYTGSGVTDRLEALEANPTSSATVIELAKSVGAAGDRILKFFYNGNSTAWVGLKWLNSGSIFQLLNNSGTLQKLSHADGAISTHSATKGQMDAAIAAASIRGAIAGPSPLYASAATITLPSGICVRNSTNTTNIEITSNLTPSLAASGANGLDTGSEANDTWYYVYLIKKSSDGTVASLFSVTNEAASGSVTLPSGYDLKRQLPLAVRNNSSGDIIPFVIGGGWPYRPRVRYRDYESVAAYSVLSAGTSTTFTSVSLASLVPSISKLVDITTDFDVSFNITSVAYVRATGSGLTTGRQIQSGYSDERQTVDSVDVLTDASQSIDYKITDNSGSTSLDMWVLGYTVTEVN